MSNMGWQCPSCNGCFSPTVTRCENCTGEIKVDPWPGYVPTFLCNCTWNAYQGHWCPVHGWVSPLYQRTYTSSDTCTVPSDNGDDLEVDEDGEFKFDISGNSTGNCFNPMDAKISWGGQVIEPGPAEDIFIPFRVDGLNEWEIGLDEDGGEE